MRRDDERLKDILEAIEKVDKYVQHGKDAYLSEELLQTWIVHHILIVGEAASRITKEFQDTHPEISWPFIIAMRNILIHEYFSIDIETVWKTASEDLPELATNIRKILA